MIYFDNAATSKYKPQSVIDAVVFAMNNFGNASRGIYSETLDAERLIYMTRQKIAKLFNVSNARNVVFTKNATESLNIAINGILTKEDHVITTVCEHNSVLRPLNYLKSNGLEIDYIGIDELGNLKIDDVHKFLKNNTKALIVNHSSNVTGNISDIKKLGEFCKENNLSFIVDASQTAGAFEIDMKSMNIDVLCCTGHKSLLAPQGLGLLCVDEKIYIRPFVVGGTGINTYNEFQPDRMPTRLEAGTLNSHTIAGLNASLDYLEENGIENLTKKALDLSNYFYENIKNLEGIKIYGDFSKMKAPIVSLNIGDEDSGKIGEILSSEYNIATRTGAHCAPLLHKAFGTVEQGMVRFSFSHSNTFEEVDLAINAIKNIINSRR